MLKRLIRVEFRTKGHDQVINTKRILDIRGIYREKGRGCE